MNNDNDILQFEKDVIGFGVIYVYVEHNLDRPKIVDPSKLGTNYMMMMHNALVLVV